MKKTFKSVEFLLLLALFASVTITSCQEDETEENKTGSLLPPDDDEPSDVVYRDPLKQPFASTSIWNMPIGDQAEYVYADLIVPTSAILTIDEDYIFMCPDEAEVAIYHSDGKWGDDNTLRCVKSDAGNVLAYLPVPKDFIVSPDTWHGRVPNAGCAVLLADKRYIHQGQPYAHCTEDGIHTMSYNMNLSSDHSDGYVDIYGDGKYGAHGGSGLSAIGGTIRVHEFTPTSGPITHALKINLYGAENLYYDYSADCGYRWPARSNDSYAGKGSANLGYGTLRPSDRTAVPECVMGSLLALKPDFDVETLRTEPAKILAQAFMDYGAYVVDDTAWPVCGIMAEWGPAGRFTDEFEKNWGFSFTDSSNAKMGDAAWSDWGLDIRDIYTNLHVVNNNSSSNIGGAGERRVAMAAELSTIE